MALPEFIVSFREFFEIFLLIGIMLAYLTRTNNKTYRGAVWIGIVIASVASLAAAWGFSFVRESFQANEALFEGVTLLLASLLVTWLIIWMFKQRNVAKQVEKELKSKIDIGTEAGVALFSFIAVFREGIELVIFLEGISISSGSLNLFSAFLGFALAAGLALLIFKSIVSLNLKKFFTVTSILLILLAGGLVSQGVHELEEAHVLPSLVEHVYALDFRNEPTPHLLAEKGAVGSVLKSLLGYDTSPSLLQLLAHLGYFLAAYLLYKKVSQD